LQRALPSAPRARYRQLDDAQIVQTLMRLRDRIQERFPGSGLSGVSEELLALTHEAAGIVAYLQRPHWPIRIGVGVAIIAMATLLVALATTLRLPARIDGLTEFIQAIESAINDLVFLGIGVYFLLTTETRIKRRRALEALHQLRSVAHIVDMHQLTKDPERLLTPHLDTASSPARTMTSAEIGRYLDYCSELVSLSSKVAALFVQHFNDPIVLAAVDEIETLATGISGKLWQKITLLEQATLRVGRAEAPEQRHGVE
jgi:hypothetical protein